jgi:hypothetical protein
MLTDTFASRYRNLPLWTVYTDVETRLLTQCFQILSQDLIPYWNIDHRPNEVTSLEWREINRLLSRELGVQSLSETHYWVDGARAGQRNAVAYSPVDVAKNYVLKVDQTVVDQPDLQIKNRISLIEIALRRFLEQTIVLERQNPPASANETLLGSLSRTRSPAGRYSAIQHRSRIDQATNEVNARFRQANCPLVFNNGNIQVNLDETVTQVVAQPFWQLLSNPRWSNVDLEMRDAIDRRDSNSPDAAFHAAKALESAIKVISTERRWSRGNENGAAQYVDNLVSTTNGRFIEVWQSEALKQIFREVRNPLGHGAGSEPPIIPSSADTDWAISNCMTWIRWLIRRHEGH